MDARGDRDHHRYVAGGTLTSDDLSVQLHMLAIRRHIGYDVSG